MDMPIMYTDFRKIISLWPTRSIMAEELNEARKPSDQDKLITGTMVADWYRRDHFQPRYFDALLAAMQARNFPAITYEDLSRLYQERRNRAKARQEN